MFNYLLIIYNSLFTDLTIWWVLAPIFILWFVMEIYSGQYKNESVNWNTMLTSGVSLSWINILSIKSLVSMDLDYYYPVFIFLAIVFIYGAFLFYISFTHRIKYKIVLYLSNPTHIYFLSIVSVLFGYGLLDFNMFIVVNLVLLFVFMICVFYFIKKYLLGLWGDIEVVSNCEKSM